jgi:hypothetical protein
MDREGNLQSKMTPPEDPHGYCLPGHTMPEGKLDKALRPIDILICLERHAKSVQSRIVA